MQGGQSGGGGRSTDEIKQRNGVGVSAGRAPPTCPLWFHRHKRSDIVQLRSESSDDKHQEGLFTAHKSAIV